jgi:filamentous hemagglutinin family protein
MPRRATALCVLGSFLCALPGSPALAADVEGATVVHGEASFATEGSTTTITTGTRETIIDYDRFGVSAGNHLQIDQPDAGSRTLNRVRREREASRIDGSLGSNGIVLILNPAGVFFGEKALVDVASLVAGAGALSNEDFLSGVDRFTALEGQVGVAPGAVLRASGDIALLGRRVENLGSVLSESGTVAIVAGGAVRLAKLDGHVSVQVDAGPADAGQEASFALTQAGRVEGQRVVLAAGDHYSLAMNHTGVTRAEEIHVEAGPDSRVELAGTLDASSAEPGASGGRIQVQGGEIAVHGARLDASGEAGGGEILVGGDLRGGGDLPPARRLEVDEDSVLVADARAFGDGGKIILYSVERTVFEGQLSARGGAQGGDGGFAEVSGAQLVAAGKVDLGAAQGESGTLLYDPDVVEIRGGSGTPSDDGTLSVLYEDGLETTDANIVIEALDRIFASGSFTNDADGEGAGVVVLLPGNDLTLRTTRTSPDGAPADLGIDLTTSDHGDALEWRVREGGQITLQTQLAALELATQDGAKANIRAGVLNAQGAAYELSEDTGIEVPDTDIPAQKVQVSTNRGDITVAAIYANGDDSADGRAASAGGDVIVGTAQGDVSVGTAAARGGDSLAGALSAGGQETALEASPGGNGGNVSIAAGSSTTNAFGSLSIGAVDVSGGDGRGDLLSADGEEVLVAARGGDAGQIGLSAVGEDGVGGGGRVEVSGDLLAYGGAGIAVEGVDGEIEAARGGEGGVIAVTARGGIDVQAGRLDASGGDGSSLGGNAVSTALPFGNFTTAINLRDVSDGADGGDIVVDAELIARGGDARVPGGAGISADELAGASGGFGGDVSVSAEDGAVASPGMSVDASGGTGDARADDESGGVPTNEFGVVLFAGGGGRNISVSAEGDLEVGQLTSRGGAGFNGNGGQGAVGGVNVTSDEGVATVHGIDTSGGDAALGAGTAAGVALAGGAAGSIAVRAPGTEEVDGDVEIAGPLLARGGAGVDAEGNPTARRAVGTVSVSTDGDIDAVDADAELRGHLVLLDAARIGTGGVGPVRIGGAGHEDDRAELTASGDVRAEVVAGTLASVEVQQLEETGATQLESEGESILEVDGATDTAPQTLTRIGRGEDVDPRLVYRLDVTTTATETPPVLAIAPGAVDLGEAGGEIANGRTGDDGGPENRGAIEALPGGSHGSAQGTLRLTGSSIGAPGAPLTLDGGPDAALRFDAQGAVHAAVGAGASFGAIEVLQRDAGAGTDIELTGDAESEIHIEAVGTSADPVSRIVRADTTAGSGSGFSYLLLEPTETGASPANLEVDAVRLGGSGRLVARGDVLLRDDAGTAIETNGHALTLESTTAAIAQEGSGTAIDMTGTAPGGEPAQLVLLANTGAGTQAAPLRTAGVEHLAGITEQGSFVLENDGTGEGPLRIERVTPIDPAQVGEDEPTGTPVVGVSAFGEEAGVEVEITQTGTPIVLGEITDGAEFTGTHVFSRGAMTLRAAEGIEIENARFLRVQLPLPGDVFLAHNDARLAAFGDLTVDAPVRTSAASTASSDDEGAPDPRFVHASLELESGGTVHFTGDVGGDGSDSQQLALLDTTSASVDQDLGMRVADARFRGRLDGPGALTLRVQDASSSEPSAEEHVATALFEGDIGAGAALGGLDVQAERVVFTSADRIVTGAGGVHLSTNQDPGVIPQAATLEDRSGGLRIQTSGAFITGDADSLDKLSVAGPLSIQAASVRVSDLSAARSLSVDSPDIVVVARAPGLVEQRDGGTLTDQGTDWVADRMSLSSVPTIEGAGTVTLGVGGGGVSAPGSLSAFEVRRYTPGVDEVSASDFFGVDGRMLDLTATGERVVSNPSEQLPRESATTTPSLPPQASEAQPAPAPAVGADALLAFLRCGEPDAPTDCDAAATAPLDAVADFPHSALATPRAAELLAAWRELRARDLGAAFDAAGAGYRAASGFGELEGASFGAYLEASREHADARAALRQLATILTEVELLGLAPEDETRVRRQLAAELAAEADVPGFDTDAVLEAVEATPIGLPGR